MVRDLDIEALSLACSPDINIAGFWVTVHQYLSSNMLSDDDASVLLIGRLMQAYEIQAGEERQPTIPLADITSKLRMVIIESSDAKASALINEPRLQKYITNLATYYGPKCVYEYALAFMRLASLVPEGALTAEVCENLSSYTATMKEIINSNDRIL